MNKSILFVVNNLNIGGPQKSLLSLLHSFPIDYKIDLIVLNKEIGLEQYLPKNVTLIDISDDLPLLMLNRKGIGRIILNTFLRKPKLGVKALRAIFTNLFFSSFVQKKQKFWIDNKQYLNQEVVKNYDYAVAVSGGHSIMYIVDFINAKSKIGWIRTEYQNLNRNIELDKKYFEKLNLILSVSNKCSDKFIEIFPEQKEKVKTFYNPLPYVMYNKLFGENSDADCRKDENTVNITTISRLDQNKGFELLIEAARFLKEANYKYRWSIYGVGPLEDEIFKKIKENGLEMFVKLKGFEFNTGSILKKTDILVHPSKFEGKSNTIDEAKYYAVPIVSTNFPTVGEQLKNNYNAIITEMDGKSLFQGVVKMISEKSLRKEISRNLHKERQSTRDVYKEFIEVLESESIK